MTPGPTPPQMLVDGFYSVGVPFNYGSLSVARPVFMVSNADSTTPRIDLVVDGSDDNNTVAVFGVIGGTVVTSSERVSITDALGDFDIWCNQVIYSALSGYSGLVAGDYTEEGSVSGIIYNF